MYIVTRSWKHNVPIDPEKMTAHLDSLKDTQDDDVDIMPFGTDKHNSGPVLIYTCEQSSTGATAARNENIKNKGFTMLKEKRLNNRCGE